TIAAASAPKSNAAYVALDAAIADVRAGKGTDVPAHLRDARHQGAAKLGHGQGDRYTHDYPHGIVAQQYLPDDLVDATDYRPTGNGAEAGVRHRLESVAEVLGSKGRSARVDAKHRKEAEQ